MSSDFSPFPLLSLPDPVYPTLITNLGLHDQLALRGTCNATKEWVNNVPFGVNAIDPFPIASFSSYLQSGLPFVSYYCIENAEEEDKIFQDGSLSQFLDEFGQNVTKLRVKKFMACFSNEELRFYNGLPNLEELEIHCALIGNNISKWIADGQRFPETFRKLKSLEIHSIEAAEIELGFDYFWKLLKHCKSLETFMYPNGKGHNPRPEPIIDIIASKVETPNPIKSLDLRYYIDIHAAMESYDIINLVNVCSYTYNNAVIIKNVDSSLFTKLFYPDEFRFRFDIYSLQNLAETVKVLDLSTVREVNIKSTSSCFQDEVITFKGRELNLDRFPHLERFSIHVDDNDRNPSKLDKLMAVMLRSERESVEEIRISFERGMDGQTLTNPRKKLPYLARSIQAKYWNVRRLTLISWDALNTDFIKLWENLDHLEEVHIEDCRKVGNVDFIGRDEANPVFLRLTGLRKLTLAKLDKMPKITDRVFRDVFKCMNLEEFRLQSDQPVKKITPAGILELANSPTFTRSLRKFPFKNWSMDGVGDVSFRKLRSMFSCN